MFQALFAFYEITIVIENMLSVVPFSLKILTGDLRFLLCMLKLQLQL